MYEDFQKNTNIQNCSVFYKNHILEKYSRFQKMFMSFKNVPNFKRCFQKFINSQEFEKQNVIWSYFHDYENFAWFDKKICEIKKKYEIENKKAKRKKNVNKKWKEESI